MKSITQSQTNVVIGYLLFSFIFSVIFSLYFQDPMYYAFTLFILGAIVLATAIDVGDINKDFAEVGWSSTNIYIAIPLGVLGGVAALILGSLIVNTTLLKATVPDLSSSAKLFFPTASIIPPVWTISANLFAQWMIIAPSEESLTKIIAPFAGIKAFGNVILAFFISILLWVGMHVPTFIMQGVTNSMYIVLFILGVITTVLFFMTKSIIAPIIAHGTYNSAIILTTTSSDIYSKAILMVIVFILIIVWIRNPKKGNAYSRK